MYDKINVNNHYLEVIVRKEVQIIGANITSEANFHEEIARLLSFPSYYDNTLDSLLDCLTSYIDPNLTLHWIGHEQSRKVMGHDFERIIEVFDRAQIYKPSIIYHLS